MANDDTSAEHYFTERVPRRYLAPDRAALIYRAIAGPAVTGIANRRYIVLNNYAYNLRQIDEPIIDAADTEIVQVALR